MYFTSFDVFIGTEGTAVLYDSRWSTRQGQTKTDEKPQGKAWHGMNQI